VTHISITPYKDVVFIEIEEKEKLSSGGIVVMTNDEPQSSGKVLSVGDTEDVRVGDKVFFGKSVGSKLRVDGSDVIVMREADIQAIL